jgi:hypothetical protein
MVAALKAHVEQGRFVPDEPADLPDGTLVSIVVLPRDPDPIDQGAPVDDEDEDALANASPEEIVATTAHLDERLAEADAGGTISNAEALARMFPPRSCALLSSR